MRLKHVRPVFGLLCDSSESRSNPVNKVQVRELKSLSYLRLWQDGLPPLSLPQQTPLSLLQALLIHFHLSQDHLKARTQNDGRIDRHADCYCLYFWVINMLDGRRDKPGFHPNVSQIVTEFRENLRIKKQINVRFIPFLRRCDQRWLTRNFYQITTWIERLIN